MRGRGVGPHNPNAAQYEETGRNRLTTRALYDTEEEEEEEEEVGRGAPSFALNILHISSYFDIETSTILLITLIKIINYLNTGFPCMTLVSSWYVLPTTDQSHTLETNV